MEALARWYAFRVITEAPRTIRVPSLLKERVNEMLNEEGYSHLVEE